MQILLWERYYEDNEETKYKIGENICKSKGQYLEYLCLQLQIEIDDIDLTGIDRDIDISKQSSWITNNSLRTWTIGIKRNFTNKDLQMANKHIRRCLTSPAIR